MPYIIIKVIWDRFSGLVRIFSRLKQGVRSIVRVEHVPLHFIHSVVSELGHAMIFERFDFNHHHALLCQLRLLSFILVLIVFLISLVSFFDNVQLSMVYTHMISWIIRGLSLLYETDFLHHLGQG